MDGSVPLLDGSTSGSSGTGGQSGDGIGTGVGGMSGGGSGTSASSSGTGGTGPDGGPPPPPLLADGEACTEDARCKSGHCDQVCCEKGSECCKTVDDCTTQGGLGMSCDDRSMCRGSAGKIECTPDFKCVTINGARNDTACSNRVEANDCGLYPSVFCLGGELQQGAPACATSCANDSECDTQAHCADGKCEADKPNGERCKRNEDCAAGFCKNMVNGEGICCGLLGDCCATPDDCPAPYRRPAMCTDQMNCRGTETVAMCVANICSSMMVQANSACDGKPGPNCGPYQDVICMSGRSNQCRTNCSNDGQCDANAYCDGRACQSKKPTGASCTMTKECASGTCNNGVCCVGTECCKTVDDCKLGLDAMCVDRVRCRGTIRAPTCENSACRYASTRSDDDRACVGGGDVCGNFKDIPCNGMSVQSPPVCPTRCSSNADCDPGMVCVDAEEGRVCEPPGGGSGNGNGNGNGNG